MSSQYTTYKAEFCIDGKEEGATYGKANTMCHTNNGGKKSDPFPWFAIDYGKGVKVSVEKVIIANRVKCCGHRTLNVEVRLTDELPTDGKSKLTSGQLVGTFEGPGKNGQKIEVKAEDDWMETLGRYLIVQMDHSVKRNDDAKQGHGINVKEVTGFGKTYRTDCETGRGLGEVLKSQNHERINISTSCCGCCWIYNTHDTRHTTHDTRHMTHDT